MATAQVGAREGAKPPYDAMKDAYTHLAKVDLYQPYEHREEGSWVVVFFHETLSTRLFKTLEEVGRRYNWQTYMYAVFVKPEQFAAKFTGPKLAQVCERVGIEAKGKAPMELSRLLWAWCQANGDKVVNEAASKAAGEEKDKYRVRVDLLKDPMIMSLVAQLPRQAKIIAENLALEETTAYTEETLGSFARRLVATGKLKTKQDPLRVVLYYMPTFADMGVATYPTKKEVERKEET